MKFTAISSVYIYFIDIIHVTNTALVLIKNVESKENPILNILEKFKISEELNKKLKIKDMKKSAVLAIIIVIAAMFAACGAVDKVCWGLIEGEYQAKGVYDAETSEYDDYWWHLYVSKKGASYYFSIYDNAAGNPGVEGKIVSIDESTIKIKIDQDLYEELPSQEWKDSGKYLELTYAQTEQGVTLENNGTALEFIRERDEADASLEFRLADRTKGYAWELTQEGTGSVTIDETKLKDPDVRIWRIYTLGPDQTGDLVLTCKYRKGDEVMYTVSFNLTVLEDGQVIENDRDGDIDEAMTT